MTFIDTVTPKDTEEVKPGLFIQKTKKGYKQINPVAWDNKVRWKEQLSTVFNLKFLFFILLVAWIWFGFLHDFRAYQDFYNEIMEDPQEFCIDVKTNYAVAENNPATYLEFNGQANYSTSIQNNT